MHHLGLLGANGETEVMAGCGKTVIALVYVRLCTSIQCAVISEAKVADMLCPVSLWFLPPVSSD